jgi:hypothetical protein
LHSWERKRHGDLGGIEYVTDACATGSAIPSE